MKKLLIIITISMLLSGCNKPKEVNKEVKYVIQIRYFDNTLDTLFINDYKGLENNLNIDQGDLYTLNPWKYVYASQVKTYKIIKK